MFFRKMFLIMVMFLYGNLYLYGAINVNYVSSSLGEPTTFDAERTETIKGTERYQRDDSKEVVIDSTTGLMWQDNHAVATVTKPWFTNITNVACETNDAACYNTSGDTATTYCEDLILGNYEDWRIPNIDELESIYTWANWSLINVIFKNRSFYNAYWSSSTYIFSESAKTHQYGSLSASHKSTSNYVRCVRDTTGPIGSIIDAQVSDEYKKQPIERDPKNTFANTFRVHLQSGGDSGDICDDYTFKVVADEGRGATMTKCVYDSNTFSKDEITIDFRIDKKDGGYYFENGKIRVTDKSTGKSEDLTIFKNFNVYGTSFNLKRDAFSFKNGDWNSAKIVTYANHNFISYVNDVAKLISYIEPKVDMKQTESLWESIGSVNKNYSNGTFVVEETKVYGACYGMALSSIANFVHRRKTPWGTGPVGSFASEIVNHWDTGTRKVNPSNGLRPFSGVVRAYGANNMQVLKKILYYNTAQKFYYNGENDWVGSEGEIYTGAYSDIGGNEKLIANYMSFTKSLFVKNTPVAVILAYWNNTGHAIVNTEVIEYDNKINLYFYDNNDPNKYTVFTADKKNGVWFYYSYLGNAIRKMTLILPQVDSLKIYNDNIEYLKTKSLVKASRKTIQKTELNYQFVSHIKIRVVGGSFTEVRDASNNSKVILRPLSGTIEKGIAYREEANIFNNVLLLPADKKYKITLKKKAGFVTLKVFVTIPKDDGTAEYLSYNNVETSTKDATVATLVVGRDNTDKKIKRTGASSQSPSFDKQYGLELQAPKNAFGYQGSPNLGEDNIYILWNFNYEGNHDKTRVIRKEGSPPTSTTDGSLVEEVTKYSVSAWDENAAISKNKNYYYGVYNILSSTGEVSDMQIIHIDTSKYSVHGSFLSRKGRPLNINVTLYNHDKTEILGTMNTGNLEWFAFNNLSNGDYVLVFTQPEYTFDHKEIKVTIDNHSVTVYPGYISRNPTIYMDIRNTLESGKQYKMIWDGKDISENEKVTIKLYSNGSWKTIANNIAYTKHEYNWKVPALGGESKLKIILNNGTYAEKEVFIISAKNIEKDTDGDGIADIKDTDDDNDGISDIDEIKNGLNPLDASDAQADFDNDDFTNADEIKMGTNIRNANSKPVWIPIIVDDIITYVLSKGLQNSEWTPIMIGDIITFVPARK